MIRFSKVFGGVLGFLTSLVWGLRVFNMVSRSLIRVFKVFNPCEMVFNGGLKAFSRVFRVFSGVVGFAISVLGVLIWFSGSSKIQSNF